ncbi:uncharacterized protein LOC134197188 [Corticium candelabrum]|uniref:uncharacterized protein LOC134197188 n=1 Tax=Corticium candelabrum TaxID=121492 RepID=UPI002E27677E|nr:uncharacterized protein LOC134197188 [Corticium candelabrum]
MNAIFYPLLATALLLQSSSVDTHTVRVLNGYPRAHPIFVTLPGLAPFALNYNDIINVTSQLSSTTRATVQGGNMTVQTQVEGLVTGVAEGFLVIEPSAGSQQLEATFQTWQADTSQLARNKSFLVIRNSFDGNNLDVITFSAQKYSAGQTEGSLVRLVNAMGKRESYTLYVSSGSYQLKIVPTGSVSNVDDFKNVASLVEEFDFRAEAGERYYTAVIGLSGSTNEYKPKVVSVPPLKRATSTSAPLTRLYVINAYAGYSSVQVSVSGRLLSRMPFGSVHGELLYLAKGSSIALARGNDQFQYNVMEQVPYAASDCITVIREPQKNGMQIPTPHFDCRPREHVNKAKALIFVYNSIYNNTDGIDIIALPKAANTTVPLQFIAQGLQSRGSKTATLDAQQYTVKAVPSGTVTSRREFEAASSFIQLTDISPRGGIHYYISLHGIQGSTNLIYQIDLSSYPDIVQKRIKPTTGEFNTFVATEFIATEFIATDGGEQDSKGDDHNVRSASLSKSPSFVFFLISFVASFGISVLVN